jgi:hypothetical protein
MSFCCKNLLILVGLCTLSVTVSDWPFERKCRVVDCTAYSTVDCTAYSTVLCARIYTLLHCWFIGCNYTFSLVLIFL